MSRRFVQVCSVFPSHTNVSCQMACCAMSNVLGAITEPPNDNVVNWSFGNLAVEISTFDIAQQAI